MARSKPTARARPAPRTGSRRTRSPRRARTTRPVEAVPVTAAELRALQRELETRLAARRQPQRRTKGARSAAQAGPLRWNPDPEEVQKSVAQLVLTLVEFLRQLMERQAIRRMDSGTLTEKEVEAVGLALMRLEETVRDIGARFGLTPEDLNIDLGVIKLR